MMEGTITIHVSLPHQS